jgi:hypothetical protein
MPYIHRSAYFNTTTTVIFIIYKEHNKIFSNIYCRTHHTLCLIFAKTYIKRTNTTILQSSPEKAVTNATAFLNIKCITFRVRRGSQDHGAIWVSVSIFPRYASSGSSGLQIPSLQSSEGPMCVKAVGQTGVFAYCRLKKISPCAVIEIFTHFIVL